MGISSLFNFLFPKEPENLVFDITTLDVEIEMPSTTSHNKTFDDLGVLIESIKQQWGKPCEAQGIQFSVMRAKDTPVKICAKKATLKRCLNVVIADIIHADQGGRIHLIIAPFMLTDSAPATVFNVTYKSGVEDASKEQCDIPSQSSEELKLLAQVMKGYVKLGFDPELGAVISIIMPSA